MTNRRTTPLPSQELLRSLFDYDLELGSLIPRPCNARIRFGFVPLNGGRFQFTINGHRYYAHRLIWKWMTGEDPIEIDHIDGDGTNNKWDNLRNATSAQNNHNRKMSSRNKSGVKGVFWETSRKRWRAAIGPQSWVARFKTFEEAVAAVNAKRAEMHGEFARFR